MGARFAFRGALAPSRRLQPIPSLPSLHLSPTISSSSLSSTPWTLTALVPQNADVLRWPARNVVAARSGGSDPVSSIPPVSSTSRCDQESPCAYCSRFRRVCQYPSGACRENSRHDRTINLSGSRPQSPPEAPSHDATARESSHGSTNVHEGLCHPTLSVEALTNRIQQLEEKLSEALRSQTESRSHQLPTAASEPTTINGTFSKTRFFGNSQRSICERKVSPLLPSSVPRQV